MLVLVTAQRRLAFWGSKHPMSCFQDQMIRDDFVKNIKEQCRKWQNSREMFLPGVDILSGVGDDDQWSMTLQVVATKRFDQMGWSKKGATYYKMFLNGLASVAAWDADSWYMVKYALPDLRTSSFKFRIATQAVLLGNVLFADNVVRPGHLHLDSWSFRCRTPPQLTMTKLIGSDPGPHNMQDMPWQVQQVPQPWDTMKSQHVPRWAEIRRLMQKKSWCLDFPGFQASPGPASTVLEVARCGSRGRNVKGWWL